MERHGKIKSSDSQQVKVDWEEGIILSDRYLEYRQVLVYKLELFCTV